MAMSTRPVHDIFSGQDNGNNYSNRFSGNSPYDNGRESNLIKLKQVPNEEAERAREYKQRFGNNHIMTDSEYIRKEQGHQGNMSPPHVESNRNFGHIERTISRDYSPTSLTPPKHQQQDPSNVYDQQKRFSFTKDMGVDPDFFKSHSNQMENSFGKSSPKKQAEHVPTLEEEDQRHSPNTGNFNQSSGVLSHKKSYVDYSRIKKKQDDDFDAIYKSGFSSPNKNKIFTDQSPRANVSIHDDDPFRMSPRQSGIKSAAAPQYEGGGRHREFEGERHREYESFSPKRRGTFEAQGSPRSQEREKKVSFGSAYEGGRAHQESPRNSMRRQDVSHTPHDDNSHNVSRDVLLNQSGVRNEPYRNVDMEDINPDVEQGELEKKKSTSRSQVAGGGQSSSQIVSYVPRKPPKTSLPRFCYSACLVISVTLTVLLYLTYSFLDQNYRSLGVAQTAAKNLRAAPINGFNIRSSSCETSETKVTLGTWPGIPGVESDEDIYIWNNQVLCITRLDSYYQVNNNSCNAGFQLCHSNFCVASTESCPITNLEIVYTETTADNVTYEAYGSRRYFKITRDYASTPIQEIEYAEQGQPCYDSPLRWQSRTLDDYPYYQDGVYNYGCLKGIDENAILIEGYPQENFYAQNGISIYNYSFYDYIAGESVYLIARPRTLLSTSSSCLDAVSEYENNVYSDVTIHINVQDGADTYWVLFWLQLVMNLLAVFLIFFVFFFAKRLSTGTKILIFIINLLEGLLGFIGFWIVLADRYFESWPAGSLDFSKYDTLSSLYDDSCFEDSNISSGVNSYVELLSELDNVDGFIISIIILYGTLFVLCILGMVVICKAKTKKQLQKKANQERPKLFGGQGQDQENGQ